MQSLTTPEFDKAYVQERLLAHQRALVVEQDYAANGADANLRQVARSAVRIIQHHLDMAQQIMSAAG